MPRRPACSMATWARRHARERLGIDGGRDGRRPLRQHQPPALSSPNGSTRTPPALNASEATARAFQRLLATEHRAYRSPCSATRSSTASIVNPAGSSPDFTSSQRSGVDTGAPARGRTEYTDALVAPARFWFASTRTPRRFLLRPLRRHEPRMRARERARDDPGEVAHFLERVPSRDRDEHVDPARARRLRVALELEEVERLLHEQCDLDHLLEADPPTDRGRT